MVCLRWMRRAYSTPVCGFNQKMLSMVDCVFYRFNAGRFMTHFGFCPLFNVTRTKHDAIDYCSCSIDLRRG
jgi:hypothetical protein